MRVVVYFFWSRFTKDLAKFSSTILRLQAVASPLPPAKRKQAVYQIQKWKLADTYRETPHSALALLQVQVPLLVRDSGEVCELFPGQGTSSGIILSMEVKYLSSFFFFWPQVVLFEIGRGSFDRWGILES